MMKIIRWIFGIPLAFVLSAGIVLAGAYGMNDDILSNSYKAFEFIDHLLITMLVGFLFVLGSCFFVPSNRKYAAFIAIIVSILVLLYGLYLSFTDKSNDYRLTTTTIIDDGGLLIGLLTGFFVSYRIFKNKGWRPSKKWDIDESSHII